jgi:hypothetical protein
VAITDRQWRVVSRTLARGMNRALAREEIDRFAEPMNVRATEFRTAARTFEDAIRLLPKNARVLIEGLQVAAREVTKEAERFELLASVGHAGYRFQQDEILASWEVLGGRPDDPQRVRFYRVVSDIIFGKPAKDIRKIIQRYEQLQVRSGDLIDQITVRKFDDI